MWLPMVRQLRPQHRDNVVRVLSRLGHDWTVERLRRGIHRLVREKLAEKLSRSPRRAPENHLMKLVAAIAIADPGLALRDIAAQLDQMGERPTRGGKKMAALLRPGTCWTKHTGLALSASETRFMRRPITRFFFPAAVRFALEKLLSFAHNDTGRGRRLANFLLAWWNAEANVGFDHRRPARRRPGRIREPGHRIRLARARTVFPTDY